MYLKIVTSIPCLTANIEYPRFDLYTGFPPAVFGFVYPRLSALHIRKQLVSSLYSKRVPKPQDLITVLLFVKCFSSHFDLILLCILCFVKAQAKLLSAHERIHVRRFA